MGLLKESFEEEVSVKQQLIEGGFTRGRGATGHEGYVKTIRDKEENIYWITVDLDERMVYLYAETSYESYLWKEEYRFPRKALKDYDLLIDFIDDKL